MNSKQAASPQIPRTLIIASPTGAYIGITGPTEHDLDGVQTLMFAGGAFLVLLLLPQIIRALARASKAQAARRKAKTTASDKK